MAARGPAPETFIPVRAGNSDLGEILDNPRNGIVWGRGIDDQGGPWENILARSIRSKARLPPGSKTWDFFDSAERCAISAKTLDATAGGYAANPGRVYIRLKQYIDSAADYKLRVVRTKTDIDPNSISTKAIQLAIPKYVSPQHWMQIHRAIAYGAARHVGVYVTRVR